ncbi:MAG TPA: hypothetical protein DCZ48_02885 [Methylococcaceae bacterium]|nr:hypothetical protein [Methylococcaceae bacterium]
MKTLTLKVDDAVSEKFLWLLSHFSPKEISIVDSGEYLSDDEYLREIPGMIESLHNARSESVKKGVSLDQLDW